MAAEEGCTVNPTCSTNTPDIVKDEAETAWFNQSCYRRYWAHYHRAQTWRKQHMDAVQVSKNAEYQRQLNLYKDYLMHSLRAAELWQQIYCGPGGTGMGYHARPSIAGQGRGTFASQYPGRGHGNYTAVGRGRGMFGVRGRGIASRDGVTSANMPSPHLHDGRIPKRRRIHSQSSHHEDIDKEHGGSDDHDEEKFEMEITDDMVEFLAQSAKYRQEREMQRKKEAEKDKEVNKTTGQDASTSAPKEQPGKRRTAEMKWLYGKGAAMIHGMETAMQLNYDRNCDRKNPRHWPHIPLNIKFT